MRRYVAASAACLVLVLAGCSSGPTHDEVAERASIELTSRWPDGMQDKYGLADLLADHALDGLCADDVYFNNLDGVTLTRAWVAVCSMYFEDELSDAQIARNNSIKLDELVEQY